MHNNYSDFVRSWVLQRHIFIADQGRCETYQPPPQCVVYALQEPFKKGLECLQQQKIIVALGVDKILELCNNLILVSKSNGCVHLYIDLARLNQVLITLVQRGPTVNNIFPI